MPAFLFPGRSDPQFTRPTGAYGINLDSNQAEGLVGWWSKWGNWSTPGHRGPIMSNTSLLIAKTHAWGECIEGSSASSATGMYGPLAQPIPYPFSLVAYMDLLTNGGAYVAAVSLAQASGAAVLDFELWYTVSSRTLAAYAGSYYAELVIPNEAGPFVGAAVYKSATSRQVHGAFLRAPLLSSTVNTTSYSGTHPGYAEVGGFKNGASFQYGITQNARIYDARIYNRAIEPAEVAAMYAPPTRWALYWTKSSRKYFWPTAAAPAVDSNFLFSRW